MTLAQKQALNFLTSHDNILSAAFFEDGTITVVTEEGAETIQATMQAVRDFLRY